MREYLYCKCGQPIDVFYIKDTDIPVFCWPDHEGILLLCPECGEHLRRDALVELGE